MERGIGAWKTAPDPAVVFRSILDERHTHPHDALAKAKDAYAKAEARRSPDDWRQRFRLLYTDILIEQQSPLSGEAFARVEKLLSFAPVSSEMEARRLAALAYLELKKAPANYPSAKKISEQVLVLAKANSIGDHCWQAEVLLHYAQARIHLKDNDARSSLVAADSEAHACADPFWSAVVPYTNGNLYLSSSHYEQAQSSFETALRLAQSHKFLSLACLITTNLALTDVDMGDFDKALVLLEHAECATESERARILSISAFIHNIRDENDAARRDYLNAVEILKSSKPEDYYAYLEELAAVSIETSRLEEADRYNQEVIEHANQTGSSWIVTDAKFNAASIARLRGNPMSSYRRLEKIQHSLKRETDMEVMWRLHSELAQTLAGLKRNKEAEREFEKAVQTAAEARKRIDLDQDQMTFSIYVEKLVSRYLDFLIGRNAAPEVSLRLAERFRAQRLAEKLHTRNNPVQARFQKIAHARQAVILSYWITKQHSYLWATTAHETRVFPLNGLENLSRDIESHNQEIYEQGNLLETPKLARDLYKELVAPAEQMIPFGSNVIIVPHGPLAGLNFETLIPPGSPTQPARYWLQQASVTVAPSLSVLADEKGPEDRPQKFLLVGGTIPKDRSALPGSTLEIHDIEELFPSAAKVVLMGTNAAPQHFWDSKPGEFTLLHISSHALANKESPLYSYIVLTPDVTHPDGYFYAHDLMNLQLKEDLVTLSACEGAGGKSLPGEGQVGLTWAILSAGANKVVASSFKVSDRGARVFMRDFYKRLTNGDTPAKALHDAKLWLASQSTVPYFWAAFQLYTR